jgi:hypothetical protein
MSSENTSPTPLGETSIGACIQAPFFFVERILVLTPEASQGATGIRIAVAGLPCVLSCSGPDTMVAKLCKPTVGFKCQPSSYVRLEAYGFFGLSEGA